MKTTKEIREGFYSNVGAATIKPAVKKKWNAIKSGRTWLRMTNFEVYKNDKNTFICLKNHTVYAIKQLEDIYNSCAAELADIIIDAADMISFVKHDFNMITVIPLFSVGFNQKFVPMMKELEKYF